MLFLFCCQPHKSASRQDNILVIASVLTEPPCKLHFLKLQARSHLFQALRSPATYKPIVAPLRWLSDSSPWIYTQALFTMAKPFIREIRGQWETEWAWEPQQKGTVLNRWHCLGAESRKLLWNTTARWPSIHLLVGADMAISSTGARLENKISHNPHSLTISTTLKTEVALRCLMYCSGGRDLTTRDER